MDASSDASGSNGNAFTLHSYFTAVTTDMPTRGVLIGLSRHAATHYCNYCHTRGVYNGHIYCPLQPPKDGYPPAGTKWKTYMPSTLPPRSHYGSRYDVAFVIGGDQATAKRTGIKSYTSFWELKSILWPWSFGIDSMHLFYLNVAKVRCDHWRGNFVPWESKFGNPQTMKSQTRFKKSGEPYCIASEVWHEIDIDLAKMKLPTSFGDAITGVFEFRKVKCVEDVGQDCFAYHSTRSPP